MIMNNTAKETYVTVMNEIIKGRDKEEILGPFNQFFKESKDDFRDSLSEYNRVPMENGLFMSTWGSNTTKVKRMEMVSKQFGVNLHCEIV